jgi:hypothetical protein
MADSKYDDGHADMPSQPRNVNRRALALIIVLVAVSGVYAPSQVHRSVTLAWDPSRDSVRGYVVYVGTRSRQYTQTYDVGNRTTFTYRNALEGRRYYFAVAAYAVDGENSSLSAEVSTKGDLIDEPETDPETPSDSLAAAADAQSASELGSHSLPTVTAHVASNCADSEKCYTIRMRAAGLQPVSALSATPDGRLLIVENEQHVRVLADDGVLSAPALNAAADSVITDVVVDPAFERTGRVFVGVMQPNRRGDWEFSVLRGRWLDGRLTEAAVVIAGLPASSGGRPRIAIDPAAHIYIAMPAAGGTRADLYAGTILRFNADGTVVAGSRAGSPVLAYGFEAPTGLSADGRALWTAGFDQRWPQVLARLPLDTSATDDWPRVPDSLAIASLDASVPAQRITTIAVSRRVPGIDEDQLLAYVDAAHRLFVIHLASGTVQRRDDLSRGFDGLVPESLAIGAGGRIFVAARARDGLSSVFELAPRAR